jgi:catechol 2,3-dioxygenase-like lactoylglutathione lyase family enzyme
MIDPLTAGGHPAMTVATTPRIARLGHVGLHCQDLPTMVAFYTEVLGLHITDRDDDIGLVFLSAQPDTEHHELLLTRGRDVAQGSKLLQQISFRCNNLEDVVGFYQRLRDRGVTFDHIVTHGNAIGVYFLDPEGNRIEVYWNTGLQARQPFSMPVDLEQGADEVMRTVREAVAEYGATGYRGGLASRSSSTKT